MGLLTTTEIAAIAGITRNYVPAWCARHGVPRVRGYKVRPYLYPAAAVRAAAAAEAKRRAGIPEPLRLRRWVAKALIT